MSIDVTGKSKVPFFALGLLGVALAGGCSSSECLDGGTLNDDGTCSGGNVAAAGDVKCADGAVVQTEDDCATHGGKAGLATQCTPRKYKGFEGTTLDVGAADDQAGRNRSRLKPYAVLAGEISRVTGANVAATLGTLADTFGADAPRWFEEPAANAVSTVAMYNLAFEACLTYTATAANYANAPTTETATAECTAMEAKFWNRKSASPTEISACVDNAVTKTATEKDARRRWAYTCAAVLASTGFITY